MKIDPKSGVLPLTKTNPNNLKPLFKRTDVLPMWVADMDFTVAEPIQKALIERVSGSGFAYEYRPDSYFEALTGFYKRHYGVNVKRDSIIFSNAITSSLAVIFEALTNPGDGIIIQPPVFMEFKDVIRKTGRRLYKNPLIYEKGHYKPDLDDLEAQAADPKTKALILCNPHNPVGRVWRKDEIEAIIEICKKHDLLLISDEIHKDICLFGNRFTSLLQYTGSYKKIFVLTSEAKSFNLPAISDSMLITPDEEIRKPVKQLMAKYNLGRTNALTRVALEAAYREGDPWLKKLVKTIENNVKLIEKKLQESGSKIRLVKPEGTYQVWLSMHELFDDSKVMFRSVTDATGIGMNAGHWFGREGALFMRMNIGTSAEKVNYAIEKLITFAAK